MTRPASDLDGFRLWPSLLDRAEQEALRDAVFQRFRAGPLYIPRMPKSGLPMRVRMTNLGSLGWVTDKEQGYRYQGTHPETGKPWPDMPEKVLELWETYAAYAAPPEACLVNYYEGDARMGLHVDSDEEAWDAPVLSISLGDTALFRIGGSLRSDPTLSVRLASGDVCMLAGAARRAYHGVDRIMNGTSRLIPKGGRINLTVRRVTVPVV
ncbi:MAG: alpha-ketoglutarate-dependent dioxygenase AlkB [Hyphomonadaceae bacterium JAD_PAG50586_4]|nr:MAG: alpha-ketoglutarate-dependent dioxygenase AlkB [Hyphomonadaceae bacterium JAD_PAG50586_4]